MENVADSLYADGRAYVGLAEIGKALGVSETGARNLVLERGLPVMTMGRCAVSFDRLIDAWIIREDLDRRKSET